MGSRVRRLSALTVLLLLAVAACSAQPSPEPASDGATHGIALRATPADLARECAGVGLVTVLHGSMSDPAVAWLESLDGTSRMEAEWPAGYTAWFTPRLEVRDASGATVLRDGDLVDGSCGQDRGRERLAPPFTGYRVDCGPHDPLSCSLLARRNAERVGWPTRGIAVVTLGEGRAFSVTYDDGGSMSGVAPVVR